MSHLGLSTVCLIAALAAAQALAAPGAKSGERRPAGDTECTFAQVSDKDARKSGRGAPMDCIVVKGDPSQDGRAALRRSLEKQAKEGLKKVVRPSLKGFLGVKPTS